MHEVFYRGEKQREFKRYESADDWVDLCNRARKHLFPEVTDAEIAAQSLRADQVMKAAKKKGKL